MAGPLRMPSSAVTAQTMPMWPWRSGGNSSSRIAIDSGASVALAAPCRARAATNCKGVVATVSSTRARVKSSIDTWKIVFRPNRPASQCVIGITIALAAMYDEKIQPTSSSVMERPPWMCSRAAFGIEMLTADMNVAISPAAMSMRCDPGVRALRRCRSWGFRNAAGVHLRGNTDAGVQRPLRVDGVEFETDRQALHDLDPVAGGILGR